MAKTMIEVSSTGLLSRLLFFGGFHVVYYIAIVVQEKVVIVHASESLPQPPGGCQVGLGGTDR